MGEKGNQPVPDTTRRAIGTRDDIIREKDSEEALQAREEHYRLVSHLTSDYVFKLSVSKTGEVRMSFISENYSDLTGRTLDEVDTIDKWTGIFHPEDLPMAMATLKSILATRQPTVLECRSFKKDGSLRWISVSAQPVWDDREGRVVAIIGGVKDITDRKQAEELLNETLAFNQMILDTSSIGILTFKASGSCVSANPAAAAVTGGRVEDLMAQNFRKIDSWKQGGLLQAAEEALATGKEVRHDVHHVTTFGKDIWFHARLLPFQARGETYLLVMGTDITDQKRAEEERSRLLEQEQRSRIEAETALRDRDEFLTIGAHELKTPLAALMIQIEGMQKLPEREEAPSASQRKGIDIIARQVQRLVRLVTALLDITRIRTGRLEMRRRECDLASLTREVLVRNQAALARAGCVASYSGPDSIQGSWDADRLEQVLENLLGNAIKFAHGTRVDVQCANLPESVRISVRDRGIGIPPANLERIFDPYERGSGPLHLGGLGMGLFISREIICEHGGSIRAENAEGGGLIFIIELPRGTT